MNHFGYMDKGLLHKRSCRNGKCIRLEGGPNDLLNNIITGYKKTRVRMKAGSRSVAQHGFTQRN